MPSKIRNLAPAHAGRSWQAILAVAILLALPATAFAQLSTTAREQTPLSLEAAFGVATPVGLVGLNGEYRLTRHFSVEAGGGVGLTGPQGSFMPRLRWALGRTELAIGAGVSAGSWEEGADIPWTDDAYSWDLAIWGNAEASAGIWLGEHVRLRLFGGVSTLLTGTPDSCARDGEMIDCADASPDLPALPYLGLGIAYRL